ncbi:MAG: response regulator [Chloroflexota bacterium]
MNTAEYRIIVVDDEPIVRKVIGRGLAEAGYACEEAAGASEALSKMQDSHFDLVLLDIKMPGKSGLELLPEIKARYPYTDVVMITAVTETAVALQCVMEGASDHICKPFDLKELVSVVGKTLEKQRLEHHDLGQRQYLGQQMEKQKEAIRQLFLGVLESIVFNMEARNRFKAGHSSRVAELAVAMGRRLGLTGQDLEDLRWASLLHDIGNIALDQAILDKPDKLNAEEYQEVLFYAKLGPSIIKPVVNEKVVAIIRHHHARCDRSPEAPGAARVDIPLGARILTVADAFDGMTSTRPHRAALSRAEAFREIQQGSGARFAPTVVATLGGLLEASHPVKS